MTDSPIERAAREMMALYFPDADPDELNEGEPLWWCRLDELANILRAIREPSEAMVKAGNASKPYNVEGYCEGTVHPVCQRSWPAMIDTLIAEAEPH